MKKVALATYNGIPDLTEDDRLLIDCLDRYDVSAEAAVWDSSTVDWAAYDGVMIRSCWDYHLRPHEFSAWVSRIEAANVSLWNPPDVVRWNMDKRYLRELQMMSVAIPRTAWLDRGTPVGLWSLMEEQGWRRAVVKPTISASAHKTWAVSIEESEARQGMFEEMLRTSDVMVQEFIEEIAVEGEWSLIFFGGSYSHAVLKRVALGDFRVQSDFGGFTELQDVPPTLVEQAQAITDLIRWPWLYARVDGIDVEGRLLLMELELIEPHLFLGKDSMAPQRLAASLASRLK
jgi:glutathione synthase/RimK-type ligase-like ATP-grasp enzyme